MEKVIIGRIIATIGLRGEVKVLSASDFPLMRFKKGKAVFLRDDETDITYPTEISASRASGRHFAIRFENIDTIEDAEKLVGMSILVEKNREHLPDGYYFHDDLVGCSVKSEGGQVIGLVSEVEDYPAQKTLRVSRDGEKDILIPFVPFFILSVDIDSKVIVVNVIEGML